MICSRVKTIRRCAATTGIAFAVAWASCQSAVALAAEVEEETSRCPTVDQIHLAVRSLLGHSNVDAQGHEAAIDVRDLGDRYRVAVQGRTREYVDTIRDCAARARAAAVFVALTLAPSRIESPGEPDNGVSDIAREENVLNAAPPEPVPRPPERWRGQVELGALGAAAPRSGGSPFVAGGELRLVVTTPTWGLSLGAALPTQATFEATSVRVRQGRYPVDIGIRRFWTRAWLGGGMDVGALAAICRLGQTERPDTTQTFVEIGVRAAATVTANLTRFGLYIRAFSEFIPVTRQIAIEPQGIIGRTSSIWVGATVGLAARFY
jgi:hypothetical protein